MRLTLAAGIAAAIVSVAAPAMAGNCVKAGGESTMLTEDLAKFMAKAALNNSMKNNGLTPSGGLSLKCKPTTFGTHCVAQQRACK